MNQEQISEKFEELTKDEIELIASAYCDKEGNMESDDWKNFAGAIMGEFQYKNIGWIHDLVKDKE